MSPRALTILGGAAVAGAIGGWWWLNDKADSGRLPRVSESSGASEATRPDSGVGQPSPSPQNLTGVPSNGPQSPAPIVSSVVPGMPTIRSASTPAASFVAPPASPLGPAQTAEQREGEADLENVQSMFRDFRTRLGENPTGTNAEIMKTIMGGNRVQAQLGPPEGQSLNAEGELLDRWSTPYFFHQLSKTEMEVRSAGPDRVMWTGDDVLSK